LIPSRSVRSSLTANDDELTSSAAIQAIAACQHKTMKAINNILLLVAVTVSPIASFSPLALVRPCIFLACDVSAVERKSFCTPCSQ